MLATEFGANMLNAVTRPQGLGRVFYVNHFDPGNDDNNGVDPLTPFLTIAHALDQCVANRNDYIIVLDCWDVDTEPIDIDVNRVHLIGIDSGNGKFPRLEATGDTSILDINAEYFEIAGFSFGGGASRGAIRWQADKGRGIIHHCWFGCTGTSAHGIEIPDFDAMEMLIEHCIFGCGLTADGIFISGNATRTIIRNNLFRRLGGLGINVPVNKSFAEGSILDNTFGVKDAQHGEAITIASIAANGIMIFGNRAAHGMLNGGYTFNPYRDLADSTYNDWGMNYRGNEVKEPVGM